jgi:hypothetical protein
MKFLPLLMENLHSYRRLEAEPKEKYFYVKMLLQKQRKSFSLILFLLASGYFLL